MSDIVIRVCENHPERETPLIFTFAFPGAEYWCPHCGYSHGIMGAGKTVPLTDALKVQALADLQQVRPYLAAVASTNCHSMDYEGKTYLKEELPQKAIDEFKAVRENFKYAWSPE